MLRGHCLTRQTYFTKLARLLATIGLAAAIASAQDVPLPRTPPGFRVGSGPVVIEGFVDLLCPDCAGEWPTIQQLLAHYSTTTQISFILHVFPLPYHTFAFRVAHGAQVAKSLKGDAGALAYATAMFTNQGDFFGDGLNTTWVDSHIVSLATALGYDAAAFAAGLADDNLNEAARIEWKYSTSRSTTGTPHFLVNSLPADNAIGDGSLTSWEAVIDPLLAPPVRGAAARKTGGLHHC